MKVLQVTDLNFSHGDNHVLRGIDFEVQNNELIAVLGVNGAGKSTLLKCVNKILKLDSGSISIASRDISDLELLELSKLVSYVPQFVYSSFPMNVFDVVLLGRRPHINWRISEDDLERVSETLRYLQLEDFAFRRFDKLSGGERQRVIIAKAISQDPVLFLLDEPTSDLDLKNQIDVMKKLKLLASADSGNSKSALIAIHDINMAARFADKIILLHEGKIRQFGTPKEVLTEENIAEVFGVTCDIVHAKGENPMRIIIKDEILTGEDDNE
tara:strand:+ start:5409 stop:6218 length:810 start_codon:yes stop_codon:yes gene_type:complete